MKTISHISFNIKFILPFIITIFLISLAGCGDKKDTTQKSELELQMNLVAEDYVKLVLEVGQYLPGYVDAYYGPAEWKPDKKNKRKVDPALIAELNKKSDNLLNQLEQLGELNATELETLRYRFLYKQLLSIKGIIAIISGVEFPFDTEAKILYDAEPPVYSKEHFQNIINKLDKLLPGKGGIYDRYVKFRNKFKIPPDKLDAVFSAAIGECRKRTLERIKLPDNENFKVEYVQDQPWGAYNWYKGNSFSVIQVNTDLPAYIESAVGLASHEGYPGHHVFNSLLEKALTKEKGWVEFSVYPLFSPHSLLAEGTANYGVNMIFPGNSRLKFEKEVLFPIAGLDSSLANQYYNIRELTKELGYAGNEAARNYLDGNWNPEETENFLVDYTLCSKERAEKKIDFYDKYRSYVINYNYGQNLIEKYIKKNGGTDDNPDRKWELFEKLLSTPQTPSGLIN